MVARLVVDALWRNRWIYLVGGAILVPLWLLFGVSRASPLPINTTALSLVLSSLLGPMFALATMGGRELRHLPVTARDLWRTTWVIATVVASAVLLATKMLSALLLTAAGSSPNVSASAMLLSAAYDFAWASVLLPLLPLLGYGGTGARKGTLSGWLAFLACFVVPILLSVVVPNAVIACVALAFGALAWRPGRRVMDVRRAHGERGIAFPRASPKPQRRRVDRLTGISRVVVPHLVWTLVLPLGGGLALASYGVISGSGLWWFVPHTPSVFDPADIGDRGLTHFVLLPCGLATMLGIWTPWARLLKVLPLSVRQINALLLLTPFATWTILWLIGLAAYSIAYGPPRTVRVEFVFGMAAIGALAHAALLRVQGSAASFWILALCGGLMPQLAKVGLRDGTAAQVGFAIIGALALCTAAAINHHTLTQSTSSSRAYRRPLPPFGLPAASNR